MEPAIVTPTPSTEQNGPGSAAHAGRSLILRDSLTFLSLILITLALFTITLFLFRSFAAHRSDLGRRWSSRGQAALLAGQPEQAIDALRTALSYSPGEHSYELLLAEALAAAGHTDEAFNYFTGLWDAEPGSGLINLQLARLSAQKRDGEQAINFFRAAIYGTWEGDGVARRREIRLELTRYLLEHHDDAGARAELLIAAGNADNDPGLDLDLGRLFEQAGDRSDALELFLKSASSARDSAPAAAAAGRLAYSMGRFSTAQRLLSEYVRAQEHGGQTPDPQLLAQLSDATRILQIFPLAGLQSADRATRLLFLRDVVRQRLSACAADPAQLLALRARWSASQKDVRRITLERDPATGDRLLGDIRQAELDAQRLCGPPTRQDDQLLLLTRDQMTVNQ